MSHFSRRKFLQHGTATAALGAMASPAMASPAAAAAAQDDPPDHGPDLIVVNGNVYTVDERRPRAEAVAVKDGRFVAVGTNAEIRALATRRTQVIDADKGTIVPGFIDAHCHPAMAGLSELLEVDCNRATIAEIKDALRTRATKTTAGEWVYGFKYDDTKLKDGRPLTRADLDDAAPRHPVRVVHRGGHTAVVNGLALKLAEVNRETRDPEGGRFGRDAKGELTGFVAERALDQINRAARRPPPTRQQRQAGVRRMAELMTAAGLTTVHDVLASREDFSAYQNALAAGELGFRVYILARPEFFQALVAAGVRHGFGNERLRIGGIKLFCDGSASERTMRMSQPYVGRPNDFGILVANQEQLNDDVREAHDAGFQVGVHANGDVAIDMVLRAFDLAQRGQRRTDPQRVCGWRRQGSTICPVTFRSETLAPERSVHRSIEGPGQIRSWQSPIWPIQRSRQRDTLQVTGSSYPIRNVPDRTPANATAGAPKIQGNSDPDSTIVGPTLSLSTKAHGIPANNVLEA